MSDAGRVSRAVLDTDILEAERKLIEEKALSAEAARRWVGHLVDSFPAGRVEIDVPTALNLTELTVDPDDHHVCSLAVAGDADYLITHDHGYSPDGLREHGVEVVAPDDLLCRALDDQPQAVLDVLELQAGEWGGGRPVATLLEAFERAGAVDFAGRARAELAGS